MKKIIQNYLKKYQPVTSVIVSIGIMLIPICVFADEIDPGIPFYYNPSNRYFGLDNPYPQYNFDVSGNIKARSTLVGGSTLLTLEDTNTDAQCTNTLFFRHYADRGLKINSIGDPGSYDNSWMNIQVHDGTAFQTVLQTKVNDRSITIPNGLNIGSATGATIGQIKTSGDVMIGSWGYFPQGGGLLWTSNGLLGGTHRASIYADGGDNVYIRNGGGVRTALQIDCNQWITIPNGGLIVAGNVGIGGVTNPQYTLTVSGNVAARNFITSQAVWNDKVFSPTYNLMPLSILESYVKEHKHLPEVAEEKVVLKNGVNIGEFQAQLLQKVEELTLYVIALKKENVEQDKKNAELVGQNQQLKDELTDQNKKFTTELSEIKTILNELKKK
ncbi:MAG TPA: hypothetical protein DCS13_03735 [Candidatus Margulisbacteria bacterium]|nr:MAG: hypothetical protein A2X43_03825 [Candidatus Margulisbacteria bacterium GWD2_39_127]HAR62554.1 hypothetical protein [Candidatus Margulisiibacteriota bacterium]